GTESGVEVATSTTQADGTFTFLGVPAGKYIAVVEKRPRPALPAEVASNPLIQMVAGFAAASAGSVVLFGQAPVAATGGDITNLAITLHEGHSVSGHVTFTRDAPPLTAEQQQALELQLVSASRTVSPTPMVNRGRVDANGEFK